MSLNSGIILMGGIGEVSLLHVPKDDCACGWMCPWIDVPVDGCVHGPMQGPWRDMPKERCAH